MRRSIALIVSLSAPLLFLAFPINNVAQSDSHGKAHNQNASTPSAGPDCSRGWPTDMAQALLQNAGITGGNKIDFSKSKTVRLVSQKIGKDLYRQVYDVTFTEYSGRKIEAIAIHDASNQECSMSDVQLFVVSQRLGP
ncbi:MAG: hypothetical protein WBQ63_12310 [Candidatus Acidiferrales bacterium]